MVAQDAFTRRQYALKHFAGPRRAAYLAAIGMNYAVRATAPHGGDNSRAAALLALRTLAGREAPPFGAPPQTAVRQS